MSGKINSEKVTDGEGHVKKRKIDEKIPFLLTNTKKIPNEIWLKIFGHLSMRDILLNIARVCQHFLELSQNSVLFQQVTIRKIPESLKKFKMFQAIGSFIHLKHFVADEIT